MCWDGSKITCSVLCRSWELRELFANRSSRRLKPALFERDSAPFWWLTETHRTHPIPLTYYLPSLGCICTIHIRFPVSTALCSILANRHVFGFFCLTTPNPLHKVTARSTSARLCVTFQNAILYICLRAGALLISRFSYVGCMHTATVGSCWLMAGPEWNHKALRWPVGM